MSDESEKFKKYEDVYLKCLKKCLKLSRSKRKKSSCKSINPLVDKHVNILNKIIKTYNVDKNYLYYLPKKNDDVFFHHYDVNANEFYSYHEIDKTLIKSTDKKLYSIYKIDIKNIKKNHQL